MLSDVISVECWERVNLKCPDRCLLAWPIKLVRPVEKPKYKPIGLCTLIRAGEDTQQELTDNDKLAVKNVYNKALKVALS